MMIDHRAKLAKIRRFDQLIAYLRDELGWPIGSDCFDEVDDLFYDFTPEELGIDTKNAAKIQEIKRLRPLSTRQPWGIFFVKFEPKRLPVVALRRILSQVTLKKRASANSAERAAWSADDLLFISNYGEGEARQISLAHFSQSHAKNDLPTLKVLGWDNLDTALHLDHVAEKLTEHLSWPEDETNVDRWREDWHSAFTLAHREVITTSKKLSVELAKLARNIRDRINTVLAIETKDGPVTKLMTAFKEALVHDLDEDGFADMYAQTIAYGLLSARVANPSGGTADDFATAMPITNPFLKELMETFLDVGGRKGKAGQESGLDFDELGVNEVVELLDASNMKAIVSDFGDRNPQEDPVIHFYELFLKEYDAKKRMQRGVFYTPRPVVSFIVRSVDELLSTEFGLEHGLADTTTWGEMAKRFDDLEIPEGATPDQAFIQILDPATGTGTFLVEVIGLIHKTMTEKWQGEGHGAKKIEQFWNDYVPKHLLPRLHGYELMMAPYAIAHMKIGLKLFETGYRFGSDERARVYLTNTLEPAQDFTGTLAFAIPALAHEAEAVNAIKRDQRFTVVIGNPPYAVEGVNQHPWINDLMDKYREDVRDEFNIQLLSDDYAKFLRFAQYELDCSHAGVIGMITKNTYLNTTCFRGLRKCVQMSLETVDVIDLRGKLYGKTPEGSPDTNVFDIRVGVNILIGAKICGHKCESFRHIALHGLGEEKLKVLASNKASSLRLAVCPVDRKNWILEPLRWGAEEQEYAQYLDLLDLALENRRKDAQGRIWGGGVKTNRDFLLVAFSRKELEGRLSLLASNSVDSEKVKLQLGLEDGRYWNTCRERKKLNAINWQSRICRYLYGPFDYRWVAHISELIEIGRGGAVKHLMKNYQLIQNVGLVLKRRNLDESYHHVFVTRHTIDVNCLGGQTYTLPLYLVGDGDVELFSSRDKKETNCNFIPSPELLPKSDNPICETDVFHWTYAILHSPTYRSRYASELRKDFPRIPMPRKTSLFTILAKYGSELIGLHLLESPMLDDYITNLVGSGDFNVEKVSYANETVWINKAQTQGFRGVKEDVWNFYIGAYQVCQKWLKNRQAKGGKNPRPGRVLSNEDIDHYQKTIVALSETIRIMAKIDEVIEAHGGWPGAFLAEVKDEGTDDIERRSSEMPKVAEDGSSYKNDDRK